MWAEYVRTWIPMALPTLTNHCSTTVLGKRHSREISAIQLVAQLDFKSYLAIVVLSCQNFQKQAPKSLEVFHHFTTRWSPHLFINVVSFNIFMYVDRLVTVYLVRN